MGDDGMRRAARTLAEVAHTLGAADRPGDRLQGTLKLLRQMLPYECCALLEVLPKRGQWEIHTVPALSPEQTAVLRSRLIVLLNLMGDEGLPDSTSDADLEATDEATAEFVRGPESPAAHRMHLAIPVIGLGQIIGVLFVEQSSEPFDEPYDENSLRLLSVVAAQLGSYLTTLRLREEEIEQARQLGMAYRRLEETDRRKDDFLAMLGHELRNPIGAINNALRVLDHRSAEDSERYHKLIDRQIRHLSRIVDDLLDASRVRLGKVVLEQELVDLRRTAARWMEAFKGSDEVRSHEIELSLSAAPVPVRGDPIRLDQVLSNLVVNALKYTPAGGRISIAVAQERSDAVLRVRDSGIGMTRELLTTSFDLFTQADESLSRSQGGLGLGLTLVRSLVERHGGTIEALSDGIGKGAEFVVRLPIAAESVEEVPDILVQPAWDTPFPLAIIVVEDNDDACQTLKELLLVWGHDVECASDGLQGVVRGVTRVPDVMLIDIGLPKLDGYEVARRIRSELGDRTPTLYAMTGYGQPEDRRRALEAGFDAHLVKPLNAAELHERLATVRPRQKAEG